MPLLLAALFSLLAALGSNATSAQSTPPLDLPLADSTWRLQDITGESSEAVPFDLTFLADGTVLVATGCPQVSGTYTVDGDDLLTIDLLDASLADCDEEQATTFLANLERATTFSVDETDVLTIDLATGESYTFDPALIGVTWQWVEFQSSNSTLVTPAEDDLNQITFNQDGSAHLETPCASGTGSFIDSASEFDVDLTPVDATTCSEDSPTSLLVRDLDMATSYLIRDGHLFVALPMDGGIHEFTPIYLPQP